MDEAKYINVKLKNWDELCKSHDILLEACRVAYKYLHPKEPDCYEVVKLEQAINQAEGK